MFLSSSAWLTDNKNTFSTIYCILGLKVEYWESEKVFNVQMFHIHFFWNWCVWWKSVFKPQRSHVTCRSTPHTKITVLLYLWGLHCLDLMIIYQLYSVIPPLSLYSNIIILIDYFNLKTATLIYYKCNVNVHSSFVWLPSVLSYFVFLSYLFLWPSQYLM